MRNLSLFAAAFFAVIAGIVLPAQRGARAEEAVTVFCGFEIDWCEAMKAALEKTTGQKAFVSRKTDGEALAQIRAEKGNPRVDVLQGYDSETVKQLTQEKLTLAYKSPKMAELHDWAVKLSEANKFNQSIIYTGVLGFGYNTEIFAK